ncbi:GumC family protein [Roseimaritima sediminicola]|uniref:GumC family protein n=1 Tax=Roseimaritima sediminicola TaxID=2662066 RepID=UPI0012984C1E|nr:hypothetical protein [Roseimaritima sediminicola]
MNRSDPNRSSQALSTTAPAETPSIAARSLPAPRNPAPPSPAADRGPVRGNDLGALLEIPFMHKRLIALCVLLGMALGWLAILAFPRSYHSVAKLRIRAGHESVSLDPTATTSATLMLQKTQEEEIVSALEILNSREIAERVVDQLGPAAILDGKLPGEDGSAGPAPLLAQIKQQVSGGLFHVLRAAGIKDELSDRELAVMSLQDNLRIHSPSKSTVIALEAVSETPEMAQRIAAAVTDAFMDEHLRGAHTTGSFTFFQQQADEAERRLAERIGERNQYMQQRHIVSLEASRDLLKERLAGIDRDLVLASGHLHQAQSEAQDLQTKLDASEDEIVASKSDATWSAMRQRIYELELAEQHLTANRTEDHPELKQIRGQLQGAREILASLKQTQVDESTTPNPTKVRLLENLQQQQTQVAGLQSLLELKHQQREEVEQQIDQLLEDEQVLAAAGRDIQAQEASLQILRQKREEARVFEQLQAQEISNVHVFQPATIVQRAVSPRKNLLAAGFLMLGLCGGLGLAFVREWTADSLRTKQDVEHQLGLPVVATLPKLARIDHPRLKESALLRRQCQVVLAECLLNHRRRHGGRGQSLGVIGVDNGAGASTLATRLAEIGGSDARLKTVLVDADTRQRSVSRHFGLNGTPGLVELVGGHASHDECLQPAGDLPIELVASAAEHNQQELSASAEEIAQALSAYQRDCDLLVVDLPSPDQPDQAIALAQHLDCVLVVIESENTQCQAAERLLRRLADSDTEIIGIVLNKTRRYLPVWLRKMVGQRV